MQRVRVGMTFRSPIADGNPLWKVVRRVGNAAWQCVVEDYVTIGGRKHECDFFGQEKLFSSKEILATIGWDQALANMASAGDAFYRSLTPGSIVHYHNAFNKYVRCEVSPDHKLLPVALVGAWDKSDLPYRLANGQVYYPYHPKAILEKRSFKPDHNSIYEYNHPVSAPNPRFKTDPRYLPALSLDVPDMTEEQARMARGWACVEELQNILANRRGNERVHDNPFDILDEVSSNLISMGLQVSQS